jgi:hypothetical protein
MGAGGSAMTEFAETGELPGLSSIGVGALAGAGLGAVGGAVERGLQHPAVRDSLQRLHASERGALDLGPFDSDNWTVLEHRSARPGIAELDPNFHGTGYPGAEQQRRSAYPNDYIPRAYATVQGGAVEPTIAALPNTYQGAVPEWSIYDAYHDPLKLYPEAEKLAASKGWAGDRKLESNIYERLIRDEGFAGARWQSGRGGKHADDTVMLFQPVKVDAKGGVPSNPFERPLDAKLLKATKDNGGVTYRLSDNQDLFGTEHTAVALFPEHTRVFTENPETAATLRAQGKEVIDGKLSPAALRQYRIDKAEQLKGGRTSLGTWDTGDAQWLDVVATPPHEKGARPTARAELLGRLLGEKEVFDLQSKSGISTGGIAPSRLPTIEERLRLLDPHATPLKDVEERLAALETVAPSALESTIAPKAVEPELAAPKTLDLTARNGGTIDLMKTQGGGAIDLTNGGRYQPTTPASADDVTRHMAELTDMNERAEARFRDSANDPLVKDWAAKGGTKLLSVAPLAGAAAPEGTFSEDPEQDARIRKYFLLAGLAAPAAFGAAAMFPKKLKVELDEVRHAMEKEMKGPDGKGTIYKSAIKKRIKELIGFFANSDEEATFLDGIYHTIPLPVHEGINFDTRRMAKTLVVKNKNNGVRLRKFTTDRLDAAYKVGDKVGAHWGNPEWIAKLVDNDPELGVQFSRTLGSTSPGTPTNWNVAQAAEIFIRHVLRGEKLSTVIRTIKAPKLMNVKSKLPNLERVGYGGRIYQDKAENLAGNELGVKHRIPIDLWLMRAMGAHTDKTPGKKLYRLMEEGFLRYAAEKGDDPFTIMAKIWTGMQHIAGTPTPAFSTAAEQMGLNRSLLDKDFQDYFLRNSRTLFNRTLEDAQPSMFDEAPPALTGAQPAKTLEEFLGKVQPLFLRTQYEGDVLGKNRMTRADRKSLWAKLAEMGATEGLTPPPQ